VLAARHAIAVDDIIHPYEEPSEEALAKPKAKSKSRLDGLQKKRKR